MMFDTALPMLLAAADGAAAGAGEAAPHWTQSIIGITVDLGIVVIVVSMFLCVLRLVRGPHLADRALAVDTLGVMLIGLVILFSIRLQTVAFIDGVLILSLLSFAGTVAMAQYIARPHMKRGETDNATVLDSQAPAEEPTGGEHG